MPRIQWAVQKLEPGRTRSNAKWTTLFYSKNKTVAERVLASVRQDRVNVAEVSRLRAVVRVSARVEA